MKLLITSLFLFSSFTALSEDILPAETELPKADFLQNKLNAMMQKSASWLDSVGGENIGGASAKGYLQLSWLPRTADLDKVDGKFKVALNLPKLNERMKLVIDNENEEEVLLDYESDYLGNNEDSFNVAIQYAKQFGKDRKVKNRIGVRRKQLYVRSQMQFNWQVRNVGFNFQPRVDYFVKDGWGPSVKGVAKFALEQSYFSLSATWQKIEAEERSRRKVGLYHIKPTGNHQVLVTGVQYVKSNDKEDISYESYNVSVRYRNRMYKTWLYLEVEPFIEFKEINDFRREYGIALSLITFYGE